MMNPSGLVLDEMGGWGGRVPYSRWYKTFLVCISMIESPFLRFCEWFKVRFGSVHDSRTRGGSEVNRGLKTGSPGELNK